MTTTMNGRPLTASGAIETMIFNHAVHQRRKKKRFSSVQALTAQKLMPNLRLEQSRRSVELLGSTILI